MLPAAFLHPENVPKSLAYSAPHSWIKGAYFWGEGKRREGRGEKRRGGTLDPHNVADRLTPLLPFKQLCLMQHFLNEGNSFQKLVSRNELNQLKKDAKYSTSFRQFYVMWKREVTCESLHRLAPVYFISCCVCVYWDVSCKRVQFSSSFSPYSRH